MRATKQRVTGVVACCVLLAMAIVACTPPSPTSVPPPPQVRATQPPRSTRIVVTRTPIPSITPSLTPTLAFDINAVIGTWQITFIHHIRGDLVFRDIQFVGTAAIEVDIDGNFTGSIDYFPAVDQAPCNASVLDSDPISARVVGKVVPGRNHDPIAQFTIMPEDLNRTTALQLICVDPVFKDRFNKPILWPALQAVGGFNFTLPLEFGYHRQLVADLAGPTGGGNYGTMTTDINISR